ncbi:hypothetical protein RFI_14079 [Reticulomyxa filosa]|uniref:C2H2-type domain-containing protein n=1 Tax=Reticulomyxa filosa TaxID=46433 RepID=X6NAP2_RETFI|nr:hypothetical protein RFI_14079 [Reticulomyxa filosa]|eukprot:ETO23106.1 hypothetical protein RFI_14079 [Reticulomyxa filosa]
MIIITMAIKKKKMKKTKRTLNKKNKKKKEGKQTKHDKENINNDKDNQMMSMSVSMAGIANNNNNIDKKPNKTTNEPTKTPLGQFVVYNIPLPNALREQQALNESDQEFLREGYQRMKNNALQKKWRIDMSVPIITDEIFHQWTHRCPLVGCNQIVENKKDAIKHLTDIHWKKEHIPFLYICQVCGAGFPQHSDIQTHFNDLHFILSPLQSFLQSFRSFNIPVEYNTKERGGGHYKLEKMLRLLCPIRDCKARYFYTSNDLAKHLKKAHSSKLKSDVRSWHDIILLTQKWKLPIIEDWFFKCPFNYHCTQIFKDHKHFISHLMSFHLLPFTLSVYICDVFRYFVFQHKIDIQFACQFRQIINSDMKLNKSAMENKCIAWTAFKLYVCVTPKKEV